MCLLYDNFSVCFKSSALDLLKPLSSFSLFVFKFTGMLFFLLFSDKQQSNMTVIPKVLLSRLWQFLYCRRLLLVDDFALTFSDSHKIASTLYMLQSSSLFQKRFFTQLYVLLLLGGSRISKLLSDYLSFGPT